MIAARALYDFSGVAIVGATPRNSFALSVLAGLRSSGFTGAVACINPSAEDVAGCRGYAALAAVPFRVDAAVLVVRAARVPPVLEECGRLGVRSVTIVAAGFAEAGPAGRALQDEVAAIAARYEIAVCGPNCLGFLSLHDQTSTFSGTELPTIAGDVAVVSQSGGMLNEVLSYGTYRGLRFSKAISSGNEAVLGLADYLDELLADPHTTTIGVIAEGIRAPDRLRTAFARALRERTPIVALKIGTSALAAASAATHTGAIAGSADLFAALCDQHGVTLVEDLEELCEALLVLSRAGSLIRSPAEPRGFAAIEISGGGKGLICDLADRYGLEMPSLGAQAVARLRDFMGPEAEPTNPLDIIIPWQAPRALEVHEAALATIAADGACDTVVSRLTVRPHGDIDGTLAQGRLIARMRNEHPDILFAALGRSSDVIHPDWRAFCAETGLLYLQGYRRGLATLGRLARYRRFLAHGADEATVAPPPAELPAGAALLDEVAAKDLLAATGFAVNRTQFVPDVDAAVALASTLGFPVVVKGISPAATHKSDRGLVALDLRTPAEVGVAARAILARLPSHANAGRTGLSVQRMVAPGLEIIVGGYRDDVYGPTVLCALGGTFAEAFDERILRLAPVTAPECERAIRASKIGRLAAGFRSLPPGDVAVLAHLVSRVSAWIAGSPRIAELDLNPVILRGDEATIVDARIGLTG